jgi:hypothetical protein
MKQFIIKNRKAFAGISACLLIAGITMSFQDTPFVNQIIDARNQVKKDTMPDQSKTTMTMKDFDLLIDNMDGNMIMLNDQMKKLDMDMIQQQVELSLKAVDVQKIMESVEESLKQIDFDKLLADVEVSFTDAEWKGNEDEIRQALEEAKKELAEAKIEITKINTAEMKKELEEARKDIESAKIQLKEVDMDKILEEAKESITESKAELKEMKAMFNEMEKDGLINSKQGFTVEYDKGELLINNKKQSKQITDKYGKYFKNDHFKIKIDKE